MWTDDLEFEQFCRSTPGLLSVQRVNTEYCVTVTARYKHPVQRAVIRWMKANGRKFGLSWSVDLSNTDTPSVYDSLDRAISNLNYVHQPERWEALEDSLTI